VLPLELSLEKEGVASLEALVAYQSCVFGEDPCSWVQAVAFY